VTAASPQELDFLGVRARILAHGDVTGDQFGLVEMLDAPPGEMPPLHVHHTHDEGFYVLSGEVSLYMPGKQVTLRAGDFLLAPRGVPHTYRVSDGGPASWLCTSNPSGFERFVAAVAGVGGLDRRDPETVPAVAAEYGIEILGPPGTMP
jgi:mannose-6-phosphate isomerase-like protein (cupin superfamily)